LDERAYGLGACRDMFAFKNEIGHTLPIGLRGDVGAIQAQIEVAEGNGFGEMEHILNIPISKEWNRFLISNYIYTIKLYPSYE
jgi:hypothetical protein